MPTQNHFFWNRRKDTSKSRENRLNYSGLQVELVSTGLVALGRRKSLKCVLKVLSFVQSGEPAGTRTQGPPLKSSKVQYQQWLGFAMVSPFYHEIKALFEFYRFCGITGILLVVKSFSTKFAQHFHGSSWATEPDWLFEFTRHSRVGR